MKKSVFRFLLLLAVSLFAISAYSVDLTQIEKDLQAGGVEGWVHGADHENGLYVFTYRNPKDFFDYINMSLVAETAELSSKLKSLSRHDKILIKGTFLKNPSPQKHIGLSELQVVITHKPPYSAAAYKYEAKIPEELLGLSSATFLVHAIAEGGKILVVEYKDVVIPVFVKNAELTKNLYRNDVIELAFKTQSTPSSPTHLYINEKVSEPIKVIEAIKNINGKKGSIKGALVLFPKAPGINFDIFAVQENLKNGLSRQYTLVNFTDTKVFEQIREALKKAWDKYPDAYTNGRNKLVSTKIQVKATGVFNEVDANQANPQILLSSVKDIEITQ